MNHRIIILLTGALLLVACAKDAGVKKSGAEGIPINLSVNGVAANDPMSVNQDQTFGSLAIYIYNNDATPVLEQAALLSSFTNVSSRDIPITIQAGVKSIYVIANYVGKTFKLTDGTPFALTNTTTQQELESILTESVGGFSPNSLLMVGKQTLTFTDNDNGALVNILLRRLQARVDVHVYKGVNFGTNVVTLESVKLYNQVLNSEVKYDYSSTTPQMLAAPIYNNQTINNSSVLLPYVVGTILQPANSQAIFYSYQNLASSSTQPNAPYLEIKVNVGTETYTYKGYITDNNQVANKYSLLQNNVYQVTAILDVASQMILNLNVLPWNKTNIEYERPIVANDFAFGAWGTSWGGINGKTMNTNVGGIEDAVFAFELKAPVGAAWTATLTNGLDFAFTPTTAGTTTTAVSKGFVNVGSPALIAVRALKRWTGDSRETEFYITVEGNEIPINPLVGSQRKYAGTDTRIKITQVASYN